MRGSRDSGEGIVSEMDERMKSDIAYVVPYRPSSDSVETDCEESKEQGRTETTSRSFAHTRAVPSTALPSRNLMSWML